MQMFSNIRCGDTFLCKDGPCVKISSDSAFDILQAKTVFLKMKSAAWSFLCVMLKWNGGKEKNMNVIRKRNKDTGIVPFCKLKVAQAFVFLDELYVKVDGERAVSFPLLETCRFSETDAVSPVDLEIIWDYALKENPDAEA